MGVFCKPLWIISKYLQSEFCYLLSFRLYIDIRGRHHFWWRRKIRYEASSSMWPSHKKILMFSGFLSSLTSSKSLMGILHTQSHRGPYGSPKTNRDAPKAAASYFVRLMMLVLDLWPGLHLRTLALCLWCLIAEVGKGTVKPCNNELEGTMHAVKLCYCQNNKLKRKMLRERQKLLLSFFFATLGSVIARLYCDSKEISKKTYFLVQS